MNNHIATQQAIDQRECRRHACISRKQPTAVGGQGKKLQSDKYTHFCFKTNNTNVCIIFLGHMHQTVNDSCPRGCGAVDSLATLCISAVVVSVCLCVTPGIRKHMEQPRMIYQVKQGQWEGKGEESGGHCGHCNSHTYIGLGRRCQVYKTACLATE